MNAYNRINFTRSLEYAFDIVKLKIVGISSGGKNILGVFWCERPKLISEAWAASRHDEITPPEASEWLCA